MDFLIFILKILLIGTCIIPVKFVVNTATIIRSAFEHNDDLNAWDSEICRSTALTISKKYARKGNASARFELKKTDAINFNGYVRSEIKQKFKSDETGEMWYGFSNLFPAEYFRDSIPEVIAQWHEIPDWHLGEDWRSPPVSLEIKNDRYYVKVMWASNAVNTNRTKDGEIFYDLGPVDREKWNDWVFHIKFRYDDEGVLEVWKNQKKVLNRTGPNSYNDTKYPYFKLGIYKWAWADTISVSTGNSRVLYIDEVNVGNRYATLKDVSP